MMLLSSSGGRNMTVILKNSSGITGRGLGTLHRPLSISEASFTCETVREGVYRIEERFFLSWNKANMFLVTGRARNLLIDTGTGIHNLAKYVKDVLLQEDRKPLSVVLTHCHFDHSGGVHQFSERGDDCYIHDAELKAVLRQSSSLDTCAWITDDEVLPKPRVGWSAKDYLVRGCANDQIKGLRGGEKIDLGDRSFEVLHLPGHTAGSMGLFDSWNGILVTGDALYATEEQLIDWYPPGSSVRLMANSLETLLGMAKDVDVVLPGHNDVLESSESLIRHAERHLMAVGSTRAIAKSISRLRTRSLVGMRSLGILPVTEERAREWMKN